MPALVMAAVNLRPGITSFAPLIERIADELQLSRGLISLTTAAPVLLMGLLAPLAPRLAVRFGLERTITACLLTLCIALALRLFGHHAGLLIATAVLLGAAIAIAGPLLSGYIKRHFRERIGKTVAWFSLSMAIGGTLGVVLTAPIAHLLGEQWNLGLAIWTIPAVLALLVWLRVPNQPEPSTQSPAGLPWREPRAWLVSIFFGLQAGLFYALATWLVARYSEAGFSVLRGNAFFSGFMLIGLPSAFVMPWLAQRFGRRHLMLFGCSLVALFCLTAITWWPSAQPMLVCMLLGIALNGSFSLALALPMYEAGSPLAVSRLTAMMLCAGYGLGGLAPMLAGLGRDLGGDYRAPFAALVAVAAMMTMLSLFLRPRRDANPLV
ncbi:MFS transporter [Stutzerimonas azotifigens]|uniref:MFS transporter n=1 Tax=Stutzerimonas azotifigens TaxID=291995 RepID=A0ABR5YXL6_9GAMM|nr:MFS transporter [Stutzerimonas azotifigens]MBA1272658.1 MFS transporter [Stutzerimonas azotifigens]